MSTSHPLSSTAPTEGCLGRVRVVARNRFLSTVAAVDFAPGEVVLQIDGAMVAFPSRFSVQVGVGQHVDCGDVGEQDGSSGRFLWRFLNHSCDPNAALRDRVLVARRAIAAGADVTFDYEASEWQMAEPFLCRCMSARCRGWIRGFALLTPAQRRAMGPLVAAHLLATEQHGA